MHVYKIINAVNGKIYIGKTIQSNLEKYLRGKFALAKCGAKQYLFKAIRKHGNDKFSIISLLSNFRNHDQLINAERALILSFNSTNPNMGYNLSAGGDGGRAGMIAWNKGKRGYFSAESLLKLSNLAKGRVPWNKGKKNPYSQETLEQMSKSQKIRMARDGAPASGKVQTAEHRKKISETLKRKNIRPSVGACRKGGIARRV